MRSQAQRNYERALELYQKAWGMQQTFDAAYNRYVKLSQS